MLVLEPTLIAYEPKSAEETTSTVETVLTDKKTGKFVG